MGKVENRKCSAADERQIKLTSLRNLRTGGNQRDTSRPIYTPEKLSVWKTCSQKSISQMWEQSEATHLCTKTRELRFRKSSRCSRPMSQTVLRRTGRLSSTMQHHPGGIWSVCGRTTGPSLLFSHKKSKESHNRKT